MFQLAKGGTERAQFTLLSLRWTVITIHFHLADLNTAFCSDIGRWCGWLGAVISPSRSRFVVRASVVSAVWLLRRSFGYGDYGVDFGSGTAGCSVVTTVNALIILLLMLQLILYLPL